MLKSVAGRQVPFTPRQFPTRLSRRVGLRTMPSTGAKKAVACPSGEQIVNGGFETGDFTGWTSTGDWSMLTFKPHSGSYCAYTNTSPPLEQDFAIPIAGKCFKTFEAWVKADYQPGPCPPPLSGELYIDILYTDGTYTRVDYVSSGLVWVLINLLTVLETSKTVKGIRFTEVAYGVVVDDCSAVC